MPYTTDPVRDAEIFYLDRERQQEKYDEEFDQRYEGNLYDFAMFQSFLHDLDTSKPEIKLFFDQMNGDQIDKCYAYDHIILLYEEYVKEITELLNE